MLHACPEAFYFVRNIGFFKLKIIIIIRKLKIVISSSSTKSGECGVFEVTTITTFR